MKLYTRTGDGGETSLHDGTRVSKDADRVEAYGAVDELNAAMGLAAIACESGDLRKRLRLVQDELFVIGADLATPAGSARKDKAPAISAEAAARLENWIDEATGAAPPLEKFVLPGGTELAARLHVARAVCRRAERTVVCLARGETVSETTVVYLNRLSDLLFAWARQANAESGVPDEEWPREEDSAEAH